MVALTTSNHLGSVRTLVRVLVELESWNTGYEEGIHLGCQSTAGHQEYCEVVIIPVGPPADPGQKLWGQFWGLPLLRPSARPLGLDYTFCQWVHISCQLVTFPISIEFIPVFSQLVPISPEILFLVWYFLFLVGCFLFPINRVPFPFGSFLLPHACFSPLVRWFPFPISSFPFPVSWLQIFMSWLEAFFFLSE